MGTAVNVDKCLICKQKLHKRGMFYSKELNAFDRRIG
jgi:hypothetical protein